MTRIITKEELKAKLDRKDEFQLVMAMDEWHFEACRIPGSILLSNKRDADKVLRRDREIVVYCSDDVCAASRVVADYLERAGFENISHYERGLHEWLEAGYPLEGTMVSELRAE